MYFDANGNPKALSKGQFGIKRHGKVYLLLDRNGNIMLCVDNLLNGFPCMVVVFGCVVCLLMIILPKSLSVVLTIVYVASLIDFVIFVSLVFHIVTANPFPDQTFDTVRPPAAEEKQNVLLEMIVNGRSPVLGKKE